MVTFEERLYAVGRQIVLGVEPLRGMTITANIGGDLKRGSALEADDLVLRMAIGTGRGIAMARRDRFAVNAFLHVFGRLVMAGAARLREVRPMQGRVGRSGRENAMPIVAVTARRGLLFAADQGHPMDAGAVTLGLFLMAFGAVGRLGRNVIVRVFDRNITMAASAGVGLVNRGGKPGLIDEHRNRFPG